MAAASLMKGWPDSAALTKALALALMEADVATVVLDHGARGAVESVLVDDAADAAEFATPARLS